MKSIEYEYGWAGNRGHVNGVPYILPDDEQEVDRLDLQHYMLRSILKGNYLAPIVQPERILDIGSGTGRWLAEMAEEFPGAALTGMDLTLPEQGKVAFPDNCHFQASNVLDGLPFEDASFDFVHQRLLLFAIPLANWQQLINELTRVTRRSGWVELIEVNPYFQQMGPATTRIVDLVVQAATQRGLDMNISQRMSSLLGEAGLRRVGTSTQVVPLGHWGGHLGRMALADIRAVVQTMQPLVVAESGTTCEEYEDMAAQLLKEVEEFHTTFTFHVAYGNVRGTGMLV